MLLAQLWIQGLIIAGVVILFLVTLILNQRTKTPEGTVLPEKCQTCPSTTCIVSITKVEEMKKEILESIQNECSEENYGKEK